MSPALSRIKAKTLRASEWLMMCKIYSNYDWKIKYRFLFYRNFLLRNVEAKRQDIKDTLAARN